MNKPTASDLRADPRINWEALFAIPAGGAGDTLLTEEIALAWAYIEKTCDIDLDTLTDDNLVPIAGRAIKLRVIQQAAIGKGSFDDLFASISPIQSFSVPGYSETRGSSASATATTRPYRLNPWDELDKLLWLLATEEAKDQALAEAQGKYRPYFGVAHEAEAIPQWGIEEGLDIG